MLAPGRGEEDQEVKRGPGGPLLRTDQDTAHSVPAWWGAGVRPRLLEQGQGREWRQTNAVIFGGANLVKSGPRDILGSRRGWTRTALWEC